MFFSSKIFLLLFAAFLVLGGLYRVVSLFGLSYYTLFLICGLGLLSLGIREILYSVRPSGGKATFKRKIVRDKAIIKRSSFNPREHRNKNQVEDISCPKCGSRMKLRTARRGVYAGRKFYGCLRFPLCRGIKNIPC